ncbi:hypothetical protein IE53DRAFT_384558 [Violaceomyces palustris]|uniref:Uncharacterized protein n=1 Tax=Violaceomyces palustris TaxID=1673888 RepID=A0ACD0P4D9_9BASI|nr:hypothetical protein IE53DRAFT_384558 [Violaceomyces palustris]
MHAACYGYSQDSNAPDGFQCYNHQLLRYPWYGWNVDIDIVYERTLLDLKRLSQKRRILSFLYDKIGWSGSLIDFSQRIGLEGELVQAILDELKAEGYLVEPIARETRSKSKLGKEQAAPKGKPIINRSTHIKCKKRREFFNPGQGHEARILRSWNEAVEKVRPGSEDRQVHDLAWGWLASSGPLEPEPRSIPGGKSLREARTSPLQEEVVRRRSARLSSPSYKPRNLHEPKTLLSGVLHLQGAGKPQGG